MFNAIVYVYYTDYILHIDIKYAPNINISKTKTKCISLLKWYILNFNSATESQQLCILMVSKYQFNILSLP